jgi:hypothetical protein
MRGKPAICLLLPERHCVRCLVALDLISIGTPAVPAADRRATDARAGRRKTFQTTFSCSSRRRSSASPISLRFPARCPGCLRHQRAATPDPRPLRRRRKRRSVRALAHDGGTDCELRVQKRGVRVVDTVHVLIFIFFVFFIQIHIYLATLRAHPPGAHQGDVLGLRGIRGARRRAIERRYIVQGHGPAVKPGTVALASTDTRAFHIALIWIKRIGLRPPRQRLMTRHRAGGSVAPPSCCTNAILPARLTHQGAAGRADRRSLFVAQSRLSGYAGTMFWAGKSRKIS